MMSWSRMSFKGQPVWVRVGADQRPVLDSDGRAEMKYRQDDPKSYRPSPGNLIPLAEPGNEPAPPAQPRASREQRPQPNLGRDPLPLPTTTPQARFTCGPTGLALATPVPWASA